MKQLLVGLILGVCISVIGFLFLGESFFGENIREGYIADSYVTEEITVRQKSITEDLGDNTPVFLEDKIAVEYVESHIDDLIGDPKNMEDFLKFSSYPYAAPLFALKNSNLALWDAYWLSVYDAAIEQTIEREVFQEKITGAFTEISQNTLDMEGYLPYLLDGAIYLSNQDLTTKEQSCSDVFSRIVGEDAPNDGINYCISLSYIFEAIRKNDISFCSQIPYIPEDTDLPANCEALFEIN